MASDSNAGDRARYRARGAGHRRAVYLIGALPKSLRRCFWEAQRSTENYRSISEGRKKPLEGQGSSGMARKGNRTRQNYHTRKGNIMSTVRSEELKPARATFPWSKAGALVAWAGGAFTTWLLVRKAAPELGWFAAVIIACLIQGVLTFAELPFFRLLRHRTNGRASLISLLSLGVDTLLNAAGVFPFMNRLDQTDLGSMLSTVFHVQPSMDPTSSFIIALIVGLIIAGLPEVLWEN